MRKDIETVLPYLLVLVMCCMFGHYIYLSFTVDILLSIYLMLVLCVYLYSICLINGLKKSEHCILVFFFVAQIIGYGTLLSMIVRKILSDEFLASTVILVLLTGLLLGGSIALLYIKLDNMESFMQKQIFGGMNLLHVDSKLVCKDSISVCEKENNSEYRH